LQKGRFVIKKFKRAEKREKVSPGKEGKTSSTFRGFRKGQASIRQGSPLKKKSVERVGGKGKKGSSCTGKERERRLRAGSPMGAQIDGPLMESGSTRKRGALFNDEEDRD